MMDREKVISTLEEIKTQTAEVGLDRAVIAHQFIDKILSLLKEQEERKGNYVPCKVKTPTGKWNGEKCSVCGTEYIGSAPLQWKFCPDCGTKMEGR